MLESAWLLGANPNRTPRQLVTRMSVRREFSYLAFNCAQAIDAFGREPSPATGPGPLLASPLSGRRTKMVNLSAKPATHNRQQPSRQSECSAVFATSAARHSRMHSLMRLLFSTTTSPFPGRPQSELAAQRPGGWQWRQRWLPLASVRMLNKNDNISYCALVIRATRRVRTKQIASPRAQTRVGANHSAHCVCARQAVLVRHTATVRNKWRPEVALQWLQRSQPHSVQTHAPHRQCGGHIVAASCGSHSTFSHHFRCAPRVSICADTMA